MARGPAGAGFESTRLGLTGAAKMKYHGAKSGVMFMFGKEIDGNQLKNHQVTIFHQRMCPESSCDLNKINKYNYALI